MNTSVNYEDDYDNDTISDISFEDVDNFYNRDDVITAKRTASFAFIPTASNITDQVDIEQQKTPQRVITDAFTPPRLGTIHGVLIPCLLSNMMGAMLFMRLPWITSQVGVYLAVVTFVLSSGSTLLTFMSLVAIATNGKLKKSGGLYVLIRKHLGLELGGSIGLLHLFQKMLVVSMYCLAASESALNSTNSIGMMPYDVPIFAIVLCVLMTFLLLQPRLLKNINDACLVILVGAILTVLCFVVGGIAFSANSWNGKLTDDDRKYVDCLTPAYKKDEDTSVTPSFFTLLALYYASASGFMGACTRSGNLLANPGRSIPLGTLSATLVVSCVVLFIIFLCGFAINRETLQEEKLVLAMLSWPSVEVGQVGITLCCIGAAMVNFKGIPRLIFLIDNDGAVPFFRPILHHHMSHSHDVQTVRSGASSGHMQAATCVVFLTFLGVSLPCLTGNMDYLAQFVALPSLLVHVSVNFSCFLLAIVKAPGFRPHWQYFSWHTALLGTLWCFGMMLLINWWLSILFTVLLLVLFVMVSRSTAGNDWGDALSGLMYQQARNLLLYMSGPASSSRRSKNWRPQLMVVTHIREKRTGDSPTRFLHESLIRLAGQMKKGEGLTMVAALLEGEPAYVHPQVCDEIQDDLEAFMRNEGIYGFARCCVTRTLVDGFDTVVQMAGVGTMKPNTLICQWPDGLEDMCYDDAREHVERFRVVATSKKALIVVKGANALPSNQARYRGYIDVWWVVNVHDGGLLILLPHLLWLHKVWHHCQLRLFVVMTSPGDNPVKLKRRAEEHLDHERVDATVEVVDLSASSHGVYDFTLDHNARNQLLMTLNNPHTLSVALRQDSDYRLSVARKSHLAEIFRSVSPSGEVPKTNSDSLMRSPDHFTPHTSPERPDTNDRDHGDINGSHDELRCDDGGSTDGIVLDTIEMSQVDLSPPCIEHRPDEAFIANCMQIAVQFNALLRQRSKDSKLVVLNFPPLHKMDDADFINYTATLTNNLQPVLLVKGTGQEIITSYS